MTTTYELPTTSFIKIIAVNQIFHMIFQLQKYPISSKKIAMAAILQTNRSYHLLMIQLTRLSLPSPRCFTVGAPHILTSLTFVDDVSLGFARLMMDSSRLRLEFQLDTIWSTSTRNLQMQACKFWNCMYFSVTSNMGKRQTI
ncbi:hypothetical protein ACJX0J_006969 [Zea mays]